VEYLAGSRKHMSKIGKKRALSDSALIVQLINHKIVLSDKLCFAGDSDRFSRQIWLPWVIKPELS
jgi:hypothetical protein